MILEFLSLTSGTQMSILIWFIMFLIFALVSYLWMRNEEAWFPILLAFTMFFAISLTKENYALKHYNIAKNVSILTGRDIKELISFEEYLLEKYYIELTIKELK